MANKPRRHPSELVLGELEEITSIVGQLCKGLDAGRDFAYLIPRYKLTNAVKLMRDIAADVREELAKDPAEIAQRRAGFREHLKSIKESK